MISIRKNRKLERGESERIKVMISDANTLLFLNREGESFQVMHYYIEGLFLDLIKDTLSGFKKFGECSSETSMPIFFPIQPDTIALLTVTITNVTDEPVEFTLQIGEGIGA